MGKTVLKLGLFGHLEIFCDYFFWGNNLKLKLLLLLIFQHQSRIWQISGSQVMDQNADCCWSIELQDSFKCNNSQMKWLIKFIFGMQINIEVFYELILSFWVCITRHAQNIQNKKFVYLGNISRKIWGMKYDFIIQYKLKRFSQVGSITLNVQSQACPKYPK